MKTVLGLALCVLSARTGAAQTRTLTACTPDALSVCAELRFDVVNAGLFQIGVRTIGSTSQPLLPTSVYNLVFGTGAAAIANPVSTLRAPVGTGGAVVSDASPWEVFDTGDALFLSALTNRGVGGCVIGADVDGFGQAARTCGVGQFITFGFTPTRAFDPARFQLLDIEAVALTSPSHGASCGGPGVACVITADTQNPSAAIMPEPASFVLIGAGLLLVAIARTRQRYARN